MDKLTFITNVIESLAWPIVILIVIILLKKEVAALLRRLSRIKHKDSQLDFDKEAKESLAEINIGTEVDNPIDEADKKRLIRLAEDSPRGAILDAWIPIEEELNDLVKLYGKSITPRNTPLHKIRTLQQAGLIDTQLSESLEYLRDIRNNAVHILDEDISSLLAVNYGDLALRMVKKLQYLKKGSN